MKRQPNAEQQAHQLSHADLVNLVGRLKRYSADFPGSPCQEAAVALSHLWSVIQALQTKKTNKLKRNPAAPRKRVKLGSPKHGEPIVDRIMRAVEKDSKTGCWNWMGSGSDRYGYISYNRKNWLVHRLMYVLTNNVTLAKGDVIMHLCDNSWCCNPDHLLLGTHTSNMADRTLKGRHAAAKVNLEQAKEIRIRFAKGESAYALAAEFGLSNATVHAIGVGRSWKVLDDDPDIKLLKPATRFSRWSQLSEDDVRRIKGMLADGVPQSKIADQFGIHTSSVSQINTGKRWKHVE